MSTPYRRLLAELVETMSDESRQLDQLLFKLVESRLLLASDEARFVTQAVEEVDAVIARLRVGESLRMDQLAKLADATGQPRSKVTLGYLAGWAPEPYRSMFKEHCVRFRHLTTQIELALRDNRRLAELAMDNVAASLEVLGGEQPMAEYGVGGPLRKRFGTRQTRSDGI